MKKLKWTVIVLIMSLIMSCSRTLQEFRIENENTKLYFVFAVESTAFKDAIREKLINKYKSQANIHIIDNNKLNEIQTSNYDVFLIMDKCVAGSPSTSSLKPFLKNLDDLGKVVLFITTGSPKWKYSYKDVDAVTAASPYGDTETIFMEISQKIDRIIAER